MQNRSTILTRQYLPLTSVLLAIGLSLGCGDDSTQTTDTHTHEDGEEHDHDEEGSESTRDLSDVEGLRLCCLLGSGCHPGSEDPSGGTVRLCHEVGHANLPDECRAQYDACIAVCDPDGMETEHACL